MQFTMSARNFLLCRIFSLMFVAVVLSADAQINWPQFRGEQSLGVASNKNLPAVWGTNQNVAWKTSVPGMGWSSPVVWGDKIFVTSVVRDGEVETPKKGLYFGGERRTPSTNTQHWMVYAYDWQSGKKVWEKQVHEGTPATSVHLKNTYASETPVTDGERVYAYFGNLGLFCLDMNGKELWSQKLGQFKTRAGWGTAASPVLHKDRIFVVNDNDEKSFLAAFNKKTGEHLWRIDRDEKSNWATPFVWENKERTELIVPGTRRVRSYDLDGKLLWEFGGMSSIVIATPFSQSGLLYVSSGYVGDSTRPVFAIRPGASGDISLKAGETNSQYIAWYEKTAAPYNPSPLVYGDYFYVLFDFGFLGCRDARTGREIYEKQRVNPEGVTAFTSSPWAYDNKIFCLSEDGDTYVFQAGPEYKLIGKNSLGEMCMATPAIARDSLVIRTTSSLYRIQNDQTKLHP
ncbi:MAG: PQQ-binding-like beta-propeller repeat protein [Verrucomicrobia bacterium]|nr:PQQ-binding-like beta-propeller repeat protein [Verrucomicrobiota bacterium]